MREPATDIDTLFRRLIGARAEVKRLQGEIVDRNVGLVVWALDKCAVGETADRKRQVEFIDFLELLDRDVPAHITVVHIVLDNVRMHTGKLVRAWLAEHPRFRFHHPPVHCSWMNQVEQWFSILQRKRLAFSDFADKKDMSEKLLAFVAEWNEDVHPFKWSTKSAAKVMTWAERKVAA